MQQTCIEGVQDEAWLGGKDYSLGIVQSIKIWPVKQIVYS